MSLSWTQWLCPIPKLTKWLNEFFRIRKSCDATADNARDSARKELDRVIRSPTHQLVVLDVASLISMIFHFMVAFNALPLYWIAAFCFLILESVNTSFDMCGKRRRKQPKRKEQSIQQRIPMHHQPNYILNGCYRIWPQMLKAKLRQCQRNSMIKFCFIPSEINWWSTRVSLSLSCESSRQDPTWLFKNTQAIYL